MSLWKVTDQASKDLMNDFYAQLLGGATIDHALRKAKLNYLASADELTADPFVWAPLVAYGSLGKVFKTSKSISSSRRNWFISVTDFFYPAKKIA